MNYLEKSLQNQNMNFITHFKKFNSEEKEL